MYICCTLIEQYIIDEVKSKYIYSSSSKTTTQDISKTINHITRTPWKEQNNRITFIMGLI